MPREELQYKLKILQNEQARIASKMRDLRANNDGRANAEYDKLKEKLFEVDMKVIDVKEELEKEGEGCNV